MGLESPNKKQEQKKKGKGLETFARVVALGTSLWGAAAGVQDKAARTQASLSRFDRIPMSDNVIDLREPGGKADRMQLKRVIEKDEERRVQKLSAEKFPPGKKFGPYDKDIDTTVRKIREDVQNERPDTI